MRISTMMSCAALAAMLAGAAAPAPVHAQFGGLKRAVKKAVTQAVIEKTAPAAGEQPDTTAPATASGGLVAKKPMPGARTAKKGGAPQAGPTFSEYLLEITPDVLDRFEKGLAGEQAVSQEIEKLIGKQLKPDAYRECRQQVMKSPEAQKIYMQAGDLMGGDTSYAHIQKASQELSRRFDKLVEPKCGLDTQKADSIRVAHADRLAAAGPEASGLTTLQMSLMKERIVPLCAAIQTLVQSAGEARVATESASIYWVYTPGEVAAVQPRCAKLTAAFKSVL